VVARPDGLASFAGESTSGPSFAVFFNWEISDVNLFPQRGEIVRKWFVVDADGQTLGRLASQVARILMGKENPQYTPFLDTGDHVIVINARNQDDRHEVRAEAVSPLHRVSGRLRTEDYKKRLVRKPEP